MERLSTLIIDLIVDYLDELTHGRTLVPYTTISRSWQMAIEARTMRYIRLRFDEHLDTFSSVFSTTFPHRRRALRELYLRTWLPTMSLTAEDCEENNMYLQDIFMWLLREFGSWEAGSDGSSGSGTGPLKTTLEWKTSRLFMADPTGTGYPPIDSYLTLPEGDGLATLAQAADLNIVSHLQTIACRGITPHPKDLCRIAAKMPSLEHLEIHIGGPTLTAGSLCLEHRRALAAGLWDFRQQLPNLTDLELSDDHDQNLDNHSFQCPDLTNEDGIDQLSDALRELGKAGRLKSLRLFNVPVSSDLFRSRMPGPPWTADEEHSVSVWSVWPSLRYLRITSGLVAANGEWLCRSDRHSTRGPSSSSEESPDRVPRRPSRLHHRDRPAPLPKAI